MQNTIKSPRCRLNFHRFDCLKKGFGIFFIAVLLMMSSSHFIFIRYIKTQKNIFRTQLLSQAEPKIFNYTIPETLLYLNLNGLEWKDEGKELVLNGKYHEILKITSQHGMATLTLVPDEIENERFKSYFNIHTSNNKHFSGFLFYLMGLLYLNQIPVLFNCILENTNYVFQNTVSFYLDAFLKRAIKPPLFLN